ncbi:hypothetical protein [Streptomyces sp. NPDC002250]|uniref:hypothetical protein n=1 Tax=Streptomyces sp. NPDC002250 TaxID=3364641 RepID=UPI0036C0F466
MSRPHPQPARAVAAAVILTTALALLYGCAPPGGPPGVVTDKTNRWSSATKARRYSLTVRTTQGDRKEFRVSLHTYHRCPRRSRYPACMKG